MNCYVVFLKKWPTFFRTWTGVTKYVIRLRVTCRWEFIVSEKKNPVILVAAIAQLKPKLMTCDDPS